MIKCVSLLTSHSQINLIRMLILVEIGSQLEDLNWRAQFYVLEDVHG